MSTNSEPLRLFGIAMIAGPQSEAPTIDSLATFRQYYMHLRRLGQFPPASITVTPEQLGQLRRELAAVIEAERTQPLPPIRFRLPYSDEAKSTTLPQTVVTAALHEAARAIDDCASPRGHYRLTLTMAPGEGTHTHYVACQIDLDDAAPTAERN